MQAAVAKAVDSLKGLGDVISREAKVSLAVGDATIKSNQKVAYSYAEVGKAAGSSTKGIEASASGDEALGDDE